MPVRRMSAAEAFGTLKANPDSGWPRRDDPSNRFAHFADPSFAPRFMLEPGQRIFTIGSCFARGIEKTLASRGFDVPTLAMQHDKRDWGADPTAILNNYVPAAIAPQIRWAFGMEKFEIGRHTAEMRPSKLIDLQLPLDVRPSSAELLLARREAVSAIYRNLASSHVVLITLGLIEAWFDNRSGIYVNCTPPRGVCRADPGRFELHVLDYGDVTASLAELVALLGEVCPRDHRIILTVSPVPLTATFTASDVAVANAYSKAVLRAAVEPFVAGREHIEYFPSYESVVNTERSMAFAEDQIHVNVGMVRFNVDRMIRRYVKGAGDDTASDAIALARADARSGLFGVGLKRLQRAWAAHPGDPALALELGRMLLGGGQGGAAEALLREHVEIHDDVAALTLLAQYYNQHGRHEDAALQAERASELGQMRLEASLERVVACFHLGRFEEGMAVLEQVKYALERRPLVIYWKARFCERLGRLTEAEQFYRSCNAAVEVAPYMTAFAEFLAVQDRWDEVAHWVDRILVVSPNDRSALRLRIEVRKRGLAVAPPRGRNFDGLRRWSSDLLHRASHAVRSRAAAQDDS